MPKTSRKTKTNSPKIKKKSSTTSRKTYGSRERTQNNMQVTLVALGANTAHSKEDVKMLREELRDLFKAIIDYMKNMGKNINSFFSAVYEEMDYFVVNSHIKKAQYSDAFKCACLVSLGGGLWGSWGGQVGFRGDILSFLFCLQACHCMDVHQGGHPGASDRCQGGGSHG